MKVTKRNDESVMRNIFAIAALIEESVRFHRSLWLLRVQYLSDTDCRDPRHRTRMTDTSNAGHSLSGYGV